MQEHEEPAHHASLRFIPLVSEKCDVGFPRTILAVWQQ